MKTNVHFRSYLADFFLEWKNFQTKFVEKLETHFMIDNFFYESLFVYEIIWKNVVVRGRPQMTVWRMRITCWIPKATNAHTGYVILVAFPLQQWLHERASVLRYTYLACLFPFTATTSSHFVCALRLINLILIAYKNNRRFFYAKSVRPSRRCTFWLSCNDTVDDS